MRKNAKKAAAFVPNRTRGNKVEDAIQVFDADLLFHFKTLNDRGVWLFPATLGCWGVSSLPLQVIALVIAFVMLVVSAVEARRDPRTFPVRIQALKDQVEAEVTDVEAKKTHLEKLVILEAKTAFRSQLLQTPNYLMSLLFFIFAVVYIYVARSQN